MSHITEIKTCLEDLDSLDEGAALLGGELVRGQTTHRTYGRFVGDSREGQRFVDERGAAAIGKCDHAIRLKDRTGSDYEIGVVKSLEGRGYSLVYDSWGPGQRLTSTFGSNLNRLRQEYAVAVATKKAKATLGRRGFSVTRQNLPSGAVRLKLRRR